MSFPEFEEEPKKQSAENKTTNLFSEMRKKSSSVFSKRSNVQIITKLESNNRSREQSQPKSKTASDINLHTIPHNNIDIKPIEEISVGHINLA